MEISRITNDNHEEYDELMRILIPEIYQVERIEELECFSIADENEIGGVIAARIIDGMPFIECIYVMPHLRLMGYGAQLLNTVELAMSTNGYDSIGALYFVDHRTGVNQFGFDSSYVDDFFTKQGYLVTVLDESEYISSDDEKMDDTEIKYATKII